MNAASFIKGLLYGLSFSESILKEERFFNPSNQVQIWFEDGSRLLFAINRGISHAYGNHTAMLTQKENCNLFDIYEGWIQPEQKSKIEAMGTFFSQEGEIRVNLDELIKITDALGVISYEVTQQRWLEVFLKHYKQLT